MENFEYLIRLFPDLNDLKVGWWSSPHGVALYLKWKLKFDSFLELGDGCRSDFNRLLPGDSRYVDCVSTGVNGETECEAFLRNNRKTFDVVLVRGNGHPSATATLKRLRDAVALTGGEGAVICEDLNEADKIQRGRGLRAPEGRTNMVSAWKQLRHERPDLEMCVIDSNNGIGVILVGFHEVSNLFREDDGESGAEDELNLVSPAKAARLFSVLRS